MKSVTVQVPASTSNLGSGFDTLGLAVNLYNKIMIRRSDVPANDEMIAEAAGEFFKRTRKSPFPFEVEITGNIPIARGLGASGALRAGIVAGLNALTNAKLSESQLLGIITELEGHPDNASPALLGGCTVSGRVGKEVRCLRFSVSPKLKIITLIPELRISTEEARRLVPQTFSKADTAHSLNRAALIAAAFASKDYEALRGLFDDRLHQPYREKLIPELSNVISAGVRAGAIGGFLSGSGSSIICLTLDQAEKIAKAMRRELAACEVKVLCASNTGHRLIASGG
jgi:homoserine kinase